MGATMKPTARCSLKQWESQKGMKTDARCLNQRSSVDAEAEPGLYVGRELHQTQWQNDEEKPAQRVQVSQAQRNRTKPKRIPYQIHASNEYTADRMDTGNILLKGTGEHRFLPNPLDKHGQEYLDDHKPMTKQ